MQRIIQTSPAGLALIQQFEGFDARPYLDVAGVLTVGYGHRVLPSEASEFFSGIDATKALALLRLDVRIAEAAIADFITYSLNQHQYDALVSFTYNLGAAVLQRSTLRQAVNRGEIAAAAVQFRRFVWAGGHKLPGLIRRRQAEAALFIS